MIPQRDLSRISNALAANGGRRIPESVIERDYCLAWLLTCLAGHELRDFLAFKGGTALRRCWFENYRFSEDLDFTLIRPIELDAILAGLDEIFAEMKTKVGMDMAFDRHDRHGHQNTHSFYLGYKAQLPARNDVKVDITVRERLCFDLVDRPVLRTYAEYADLPEGPTVRTYSLEEIVIEKVSALSDKARTEPRDLYDLWNLLDTTDIRLGDLRGKLADKLEIRHRKVDGVAAVIAAKEDRLARLWAGRLANQIGELPGFEDVFRRTMRALREADLL